MFTDAKVHIILLIRKLFMDYFYVLIEKKSIYRQNVIILTTDIQQLRGGKLKKIVKNLQMC